MTLTKEKITLMQELGMDTAIRLANHEEENRLVVEEMTALKFKPISMAEIRDRLLTPHRRKAAWGQASQVFASVPFLAATAVCIYRISRCNVQTDGGQIVILSVIGLTAGIVALVNAVSSLLDIGPAMREIELGERKLSDWVEPISQGALLAVKEAKAKGLCEFQVYYPVKDTSLNDPIIVGHKNDLMFEVAYWDDKILREESVSGL